MSKIVYFDMDGTVYDLYNVPQWLELLRSEQEQAFSLGKPLVDMKALAIVCNELINGGWQIGVITWLPMQASADYNDRCTKVKKEWQEKHMPYVSQFHAQIYGVPKQKAVKKSKTMVLVDDNNEVGQMWATPKQRKHIDAKGDIIVELRKLLTA